MLTKSLIGKPYSRAPEFDLIEAAGKAVNRLTT